MMATRLLLALAGLTLPSFLLAWPTYRALIPNGNQVPHPCDRTQIWEGVGHEDPNGGGQPNPFGVDFAKSNKTWSPSLCRMDSDGDGLTNGQELGDPYCVWSSGALPSIRDPSEISHPGICEPINSGACIGKNLFLTRFCPGGMPLTSTPGPTNYCQMPDTPLNGYVINNSPSRNGMRYVAGDYIQYDCNRGFKMAGIPTIYCQRDGSWSVKPTCLVPSVIARTNGVCPGVVTPDNSYIVWSSSQQSNGMYASGDTIRYSCSVGYTLQGSANITCRSNGTWTDRPYCQSNLELPHNPDTVTCLAPQTPINGFIANRQPLHIYPQYSIGDMLAYSCETGYSISNRSAIQCMSDGVWSAPVPTCYPSVGGVQLSCTCPKPILLENAFISNSPVAGILDEYNIGDVLKISCVQGFVVATTYSVIQCNSDGYWQPTTMPYCRRNVRNSNDPYCLTPTPPDHGYILGGQSPQPNGDVNYGYYSVGDEVRFACMQGYRMAGTATVRCQQDGTWFGQQLPTCNRAPLVDTSVTCDLPTLPDNALIQSQTRPWSLDQGQRYIIGSFVMFGCQAGYGPLANSGKATIMCNKGGVWSSTTFKCTPLPLPPDANVTCLAPRSPDNAYIFASSPSPGSGRYAVGDFIQYTCMDGFASDERPVVICQPSGQFMPQVTMNCIRIAKPQVGQVSCLAPPLAVDTFVTQVSPLQIGNRYALGESIHYACIDGYSTSDITIIQCVQDSKWSAPIPVCRKNDKYSPVTTPCTAPRIPDNSFIMNSSPNRLYYAGDVIQYGCNDGYTVSGNSNRASCTNDGTWTPLYFACQRNVRVAVTVTTCEPPQVPGNAYVVSRSISLVGLRYSPSDYIQYACNSGFSMVGNSTNTCNRDGSWSGAPTCLRINASSQ